MAMRDKIEHAIQKQPCTCLLYTSLQGRPEQAPELFREHKLAEVSFFGPCRPLMSLIEQQVWLAQGEYVKVIAHSAVSYTHLDVYKRQSDGQRLHGQLQVWLRCSYSAKTA